MQADQNKVESALDRLLGESDFADPQLFWGAQFDLGLAWVWFPEGHGGLGVSRRYSELVNRRLTEAGAPTWNREFNILGIGMGSGVLNAHGTEEQKRRWLRPMFTNQELWCQLFSEPGAGSDLAGLATRAVRDGEEWVINGQKVWTTLAHVSKWGMIPARTDPNLPKHQGLTYFVVDMKAPGVEVRPLYQITGEAEFNEVFFTDVRIPDDQRIDEVGAGWRVSMTTLMNERVAIGGNTVPRGSGTIAGALEVWKRMELTDDVLRDRLVSLWIDAEAQRLTSIRANQLAARGTPGPEGSTGKLAWADLNKRVTSFTMDMLGLEGTLFPGGYELKRPDRSTARTPQHSFLRTRANSIEGGTSEIMKNILGERVLGLPGEPRTDKDLPWKEVPRG